MKSIVFLVELDEKKLLSYYICDIERYEEIFLSKELKSHFSNVEECIFSNWLSKITGSDKFKIIPVCQTTFIYEISIFDIIVNELEQYYVFQKEKITYDESIPNNFIFNYQEHDIFFENFLQNEESIVDLTQEQKEEILKDADYKTNFCISKMVEILNESIDHYEKEKKSIMRKKELNQYEMNYLTQLIRKYKFTGDKYKEIPMNLKICEITASELYEWIDEDTNDGERLTTLQRKYCFEEYGEIRSKQESYHHQLKYSQKYQSTIEGLHKIILKEIASLLNNAVHLQLYEQRIEIEFNKEQDITWSIINYKNDNDKIFYQNVKYLANLLEKEDLVFDYSEQEDTQEDMDFSSDSE